MPYRYELEPVARRQLRRLNPNDRRRIHRRIRALIEQPRSHISKQLEGRLTRWSTRVGDLRIIYAVNDPERLITIEAIGNRDSIYEQMRRRS